MVSYKQRVIDPLHPELRSLAPPSIGREIGRTLKTTIGRHGDIMAILPKSLAVRHGNKKCVRDSIDLPDQGRAFTYNWDTSEIISAGLPVLV